MSPVGVPADVALNEPLEECPPQNTPPPPLNLTLDTTLFRDNINVSPYNSGSPALFIVPAVLLPSTNLSSRFGNANVVLPSPAPYVVPTAENSVA